MTPAVFAHGSLRLYLLSLLEERPRHGYELMQALSERFGGTYSPSAGTIYPRLAKLEDEGLVTKVADGRKTTYEITDAGRQELEDRREELDAIEEDVTDSVRRLADEVRAGVDEAMRSLRAELASAAREARRQPRGPEAREREAEARERAERIDARIASRVALRDAELAVAEFRQQLRAELRAHVARGRLLDEDAVAQLREGLAEVRDRLRASLGRG